MLYKIIKTEMALKKYLAHKGVNPFAFGWSIAIAVAQTVLLLLILLK